jgi:hypothetical protein
VGVDPGGHRGGGRGERIRVALRDLGWIVNNNIFWSMSRAGKKVVILSQSRMPINKPAQ